MDQKEISNDVWAKCRVERWGGRFEIRAGRKQGEKKRGAREEMSGLCGQVMS